MDRSNSFGTVVLGLFGIPLGLILVLVIFIVIANVMGVSVEVDPAWLFNAMGF